MCHFRDRDIVVERGKVILLVERTNVCSCDTKNELFHDPNIPIRNHRACSKYVYLKVVSSFRQIAIINLINITRDLICKRMKEVCCYQTDVTKILVCFFLVQMRF